MTDESTLVILFLYSFFYLFCINYFVKRLYCCYLYKIKKKLIKNLLYSYNINNNNFVKFSNRKFFSLPQ